MKSSGYGILALALAIAAPPALAHHSTAMFNKDKVVTVTGVVTDYQWTNPHTWIELDVPGAKGVGHWSIEGGSTRVMEGFGWRVRTLKPGDRVTIDVHPFKNGKAGGLLMKAVLPDGRTLIWKPA
jgi:hypothetical protein